MSDPLAALASIPEIDSSLTEARTAIDELRWLKPVRSDVAAHQVLSLRTQGYAHAALEGAALPDDVLTDPDSSAMGQLAARCLIASAELLDQVLPFTSAPGQSWARLHSLLDDHEQRGALRQGDDFQDEFHLGVQVPSSLVSERMIALAELIKSSASPALLIAAVAQAEISVIQPFVNHSHTIARMTSRLVLAAKDVDPHMLCQTELAMNRMGRATYVQALKAYATGSRVGLIQWVTWFSNTQLNGARLAKESILSSTS